MAALHPASVYGINRRDPDLRIYSCIYKEETAAPFVFCLRKPEAARKMTTELLAAY